MKTIALLLMLALRSAAAVFFDGSNDYITFGSATNCGGSNFTVMCWFYRMAGGSTASTGSGGMAMTPLVMKLVGEADGSNLDGNYALGVATNRLGGDFENFATGLNKPVFGKTTSLTTNVWYHAAMTYDGANFVLYLNGSPEGTNATATYPRFDSIQHLGIGRALNSSGTASGAFRGFIEDVRIWDVALTAGQVQQIAAGATMAVPRPRGHYPLKDYPVGDGTSRVRGVSDLAGLNRGTITNGATWSAGIR